jgi:cytochrome b
MNTPDRVRVWDAPTRIVHWALVLLVGASWWTAENGVMDWHRYSGYSMLGLLIFRIYWGFAGGSTARFSSFVRGPRRTLAYLRSLRDQNKPPAVPGHNPLGAWSVLALLALLLTQVGLGLFAVDVDGIESGPLSAFVSFDAGRQLAEWHEDLFNVLLFFIGLHLVAVLFYLLARRQNLIGAMVHGRATYEVNGDVQFAPAWRVVLGMLIAALAVWQIVTA